MKHKLNFDFHTPAYVLCSTATVLRTTCFTGPCCFSRLWTMSNSSRVAATSVPPASWASTQYSWFESCLLFAQKSWYAARKRARSSAVFHEMRSSVRSSKSPRRELVMCGYGDEIKNSRDDADTSSDSCEAW
mgnify:CR=1 FL=1